MSTEDEVLARYSTPRLRRNELPRAAKKLNMEFDAQYNRMTKAERDEFLDMKPSTIWIRAAEL